MNKEFVPYEQALALKGLGFDEPCLAFYNHQSILIMMAQENEEEVSTWKNSYVPLGKQYAAPTFSQAFRWFREKYGLFGAPNVISYEGGRYLWFFDINSIILPLGTDLGETYDYETYEEAELECLKKLIEITKTK